MKRLRQGQFVVLFLLVVSVSVWAQTDAKQDTKAHCPSSHPSFPSMTYDEDNRYLRNPECRTELLDRLKYIPLGENENYYLSFGVSVRERGEYYSNPNWASRAPGTAYLLQRIYAHADLHLGERLRFFTEFGSSIESGRKGGPRPSIDKNKLDVHQAFADVVVWQAGKNSVKLRVGRQEMAFGDQSFVSTRDGRNVRRSFDGGRATGKFGEWTADAFAVRQSTSRVGFFDDAPDHTTSFWGLYASRPFRTLPGGHVDLYYMGLDNKKETYDQGTGREQRETVGSRVWGNTEHWDYNQEYTFQWGSFGSDHIRAWAVAAETGYRLDQALFKPRFAIKSDAYSGDRHRSDRSLNTFNALYEKGPYFSYAELFGKRNLMALQPSVQLSLPLRITLTPNAAFYWRQSTEDGLYAVATGAVVVSGRRSDERYIGSHVATQFKWSVDRHTTVFAEYLHFFPGSFLKQSTAGRNTNYTTWWLEYRF